MALRYINYKSDFKVVITIDESLSGYPFRFIFFVGRNRYVCTYDGTTYTNCEQVDETHILCALDNHDFPQGRLFADSCFYLTDSDYTDGNAEVHTREMLDIMLTDGATDEETNAEVEYSVLVAALRGYSAYELAVKNGYKGTEKKWLVSLAPQVIDGYWWSGGENTGIQADYSEAETARVNAELARQDAEAARVLAEQARVAAETARAQAEADRATAEAARISAETARANAETTRAQAETARVNAEAGRVDAETARVSAEQARVAAEVARVAAETARVTAENARASAEAERVTNEQARVANENARVSAEAARVTAEAARAAAETARDTAYTEAEAARDTAYQQAEQARDAEFASKEETRDAANEAALNAAETLAGLQEQVDEIGPDLVQFGNRVTALENGGSTGYHYKVSEDGFFIVDDNNYVGFSLTNDGLDCGQLTSHFISLIKGIDGFLEIGTTAGTAFDGLEGTQLKGRVAYLEGLADANSFKGDRYMPVTVISTSYRPNHDCTWVGNEFWSFDKPTDGGTLQIYDSSFNVVATQTTSFYETRKDSSSVQLQMKSIDWNAAESLLMIGNGASNYSTDDSYAYIFYEAANWKNATETITFENCGEYKKIDFTSLGYKCYAFFGPQPDLVFVSVNLFGKIALVQLGRGTNDLGSGTYEAAESGKFNGSWKQIKVWTQSPIATSSFAAHGGQYYKGDLYIATNNSTVCQVYKCILGNDGKLQFEVLHLDYFNTSGNQEYLYIDGMCIKDGVLYAQPLTSKTGSSNVVLTTNL